MTVGGIGMYSAGSGMSRQRSVTVPSCRRRRDMDPEAGAVAGQFRR